MASIATIVKNTNEYAACLKAKRSSFRWLPVTARDILAFVTLIFTGMVEVPSISYYWNNDDFFGQAFMNDSYMSRQRFQNVLSGLHLCNSEEEDDNQKKKKHGEKYDPLHKVKPFMNELQHSCWSLFVPGQNACIDERMVASKGRFCMKQVIKRRT